MNPSPQLQCSSMWTTPYFENFFCLNVIWSVIGPINKSRVYYIQDVPYSYILRAFNSWSCNSDKDSRFLWLLPVESASDRGLTFYVSQGHKELFFSLTNPWYEIINSPEELSNSWWISKPKKLLKKWNKFTLTCGLLLEPTMGDI